MAKNPFETACRLNLKIETGTTEPTGAVKSLGLNQTGAGFINCIELWKQNDEALDNIFDLYTEKLTKLQNKKSRRDKVEKTKEVKTAIKECKIVLEMINIITKYQDKEKERQRLYREAVEREKKLIQAQARAEENELSAMDKEELEKQLAIARANRKKLER